MLLRMLDLAPCLWWRRRAQVLYATQCMYRLRQLTCADKAKSCGAPAARRCVWCSCAVRDALSDCERASFDGGSALSSNCCELCRNMANIASSRTLELQLLLLPSRSVGHSGNLTGRVLDDSVHCLIHKTSYLRFRVSVRVGAGGDGCLPAGQSSAS